MRLARTTAFLFVLLLANVALAAAGVTVSQQGDNRKVLTDSYEAIVAKDGCLTNLRVKGGEFLAPKVAISRGSYFFQDGPLKLADIEQPSDNVIVAKSDKAEIRYEFAADAMTWSVSNKTDKPMSFFLVFDPLVKSSIDDHGDATRLPAEKQMPSATFFRGFGGEAGLLISGATRQWGPWERNHAVWEATLSPNETRKIELRVTPETDDQRSKLADLNEPPKEAELTVLAPMDYQVFQRQTRTQGRVRFSGRIQKNCDAVEVRLLNGSGKTLDGSLSEQWVKTPVAPVTGAFLIDLPAPAGGWYKAEVRAMLNGSPIATASVDHVGIGEVFVGAGQSNSTNYGGEGRLSTETKMVSTFSGNDWRLADDPQPGTHDASTGGSFWPAFGDAMYEKYRVPIGVAVTGHGGTSINQWQKDGELFAWTLGRIGQLGPGGFRALLWHQGETDTGMSTKEYYNGLATIIHDMKQAAGWDFPWFVAQVSYHNPEQPSADSTRNAQKELWANGIALEGPDTDALTGDYRDNQGKGIHLSPKGLRAHGKLWSEKVSAYLDLALAK